MIIHRGVDLRRDIHVKPAARHALPAVGTQPHLPQRKRGEALEATLAILSAAAEAGTPCPSNREIADRLGLVSIARPVELLHLLEAEGRIIVRRFHKSRIVTIVETGRQTAPPANTTPHWRTRP